MTKKIKQPNADNDFDTLREEIDKKTEEISKLIIFLSSDHNSYITGQNFIIDGGVTCR